MQGFGPSPSVGMSATPFYDMGILGNGQIVGLADSGIDWDNCLFRDANNPIVKTNSINMNHRWTRRSGRAWNSRSRFDLWKYSKFGFQFDC